MDRPSFPTTLHDALFAWEALGDATLVTKLNTWRGGVAEQIDWPRSTPALRRRLPSVTSEARLLLGLPAAASLGLVTMRATNTGGCRSRTIEWRRCASEPPGA